jgi:hypothetical protein
MFKMFSNGASEGSWPLSKIATALKNTYGTVDTLGEDGPLKVYGVEENGVNFVVALMQSAAGSGKVVEIGFLARFVGFSLTVQAIEGLNRNLHISVAALEGEDLFLMAGLQITGKYDDGQFALVLEAWRRDLMVMLYGLSGEQASMVEAFPAAKMAAARTFATNKAPSSEPGAKFDMLSSFLGAEASKEICDECGGKGKRGLIARTCLDCDGSGFVAPRRH